MLHVHYTNVLEIIECPFTCGPQAADRLKDYIMHTSKMNCWDVSDDS